MRRPISSKPDTCTEGMDVDAAGISVKVGAHYPGRSADLPCATAVERRRDESAEVSRGYSVHWTALRSGGLESLWRPDEGSHIPITEELCGHSFSASAISAVNKTLDEGLEKFAKRRLEESYPYLVLDARYEKIREDGVIRSQAVQIAIDLLAAGAHHVKAGQERDNFWNLHKNELRGSRMAP